MNITDKKQCPVEALHRGLLIIDRLAVSAGGLKLSELSDYLNLQRTTTHNLLKTLVFSGYAENDGNGTYRLGRHLRELCRMQQLGNSVELPSLMNALTSQIGESLVLAHLVDGRREVLYHTQPQRVVQVSTSMVEQNSSCLWNLETGIILAAYSTPDVLTRILEVNGLPPSSPIEQQSSFLLEDMLAQVRATGYVSLPHSGLYAAAVPILDANGGLLASLGLNQPLYRHDESQESNLIKAMQEGARRIAAQCAISTQ